MKAQTRINDIYASRREFLEPELFLSCAEYAGEAEEEKTRLYLLSPFLARAFLSGKSASLTDRMLAIEAGEEFRTGGKKMTLRSAEARVLSEPRKYKRDEIDANAGDVLADLNTLSLRKLDVLEECSEALGFSTYGEILRAVDGSGISSSAGEAEKFIRDTDYIAGDMFEWFLMKKIEVRLNDASFSDAEFLFNSAELGGYFPKPDFEAFTGKVLGGMNLTPIRAVGFDTAKRIGKAVDGFSLILGPPLETAVSIYPLGGIRDYDSLLGSLGQALCWAFTEPGDDFEFVYLRDPLLTDIFSTLLSGLVYEHAWLKRYLRIDAGGDLHNFLHLRRLMSARLDAARAVCVREIYGARDTGELPAVFSEIMSGAAKCRYDGRRFLPEFLSPARTKFRFNALLAAPGLRLFMKEAFDEEWWRTSEAGDFMRDVWSRGGRVTAESLLRRCGCMEWDSDTLVRDFEEALG